ncbi:MAG: flagellar biosynthesis protein FliQ [Pseudomonadales bacterium]|nr:flagellar biosynthesis protein FliQ [Pseudomonadales bacterium]
MNPDEVISLFGDALYLVILMVAVCVVPSLLVGLVVSIFQAATQINEQTLSFLPRLLTTLLALMIAGPWMLQELMDLFKKILQGSPL